MGYREDCVYTLHTLACQAEPEMIVQSEAYSCKDSDLVWLWEDLYHD